jgi:hypothetical protein
MRPWWRDPWFFVSTSCTLVDAVRSACLPTWGGLGKTKGPEIESYYALALRPIAL